MSRQLYLLFIEVENEKDKLFIKLEESN